MQLTRSGALASIALAVLTAAAAGDARADGELTLRTVYYKERATRVIQPMLDGRFSVGETGTANAHVLADAITSASIAAGTMLEEKRYEAGGGYLHQLDDVKVGGLVRFSTEPDYESVYGGLRGSVELLDKNLTIGVAGGVGTDRLNNAGEGAAAPRREGKLASYLGSLTVSQILSENMIAAVTYDLSRLDGFQANIYRRVIAGGEVRPELHPEERTRHAAAATVRRFVPRTDTTVVVGYRLYQDDWGIRAHTPELRLIQEAGSDVIFGMRYRFHAQTAADFYQDIYSSPDETYVTDDPKLSSFRSHTIGARFEVAGAALGLEGTLGDLRGELVIEYVAQDNRFGNAGIANAALTYPLVY